MHRLTARLVALATLLFVALAVAQTGNLGTVAAVVTAAVLAAAVAGALVVILSGEVTGGARTRAREQALYEVPAPSHPDTAGRPRTRAPSGVTQAA